MLDLYLRIPQSHKVAPPGEEVRTKKGKACWKTATKWLHLHILCFHPRYQACAPCLSQKGGSAYRQNTQVPSFSTCTAELYLTRRSGGFFSGTCPGGKLCSSSNRESLDSYERNSFFLKFKPAFISHSFILKTPTTKTGDWGKPFVWTEAGVGMWIWGAWRKNEPLLTPWDGQEGHFHEKGQGSITCDRCSWNLEKKKKARMTKISEV